jgi:ankyrin repeat protein
MTMTSASVLPGLAFLVSLVAATPAGAQIEPPAPTEIRAAARKAVALLQHSVAVWDRKQTCFSCHHQGLAITTFRQALDRGVPIDARAARASSDRAFRALASLDLAVQAVQQIDPAPSTGAWMIAAHEAGVVPSLPLAVYARTLANRQEPEGYWLTIDARPPQSSSRVTATAIAARAMQLYAPDTLADEVRARVARARTWLETVQPSDTEERTYQLIGLAWTGRTAAELRPLVDRVLAEQRADGGWAQLPRLESDAYATGETLLALHRAGGLSTRDAAWQKGLRFLLRTQQADGSWRVRTRVHEQDLVSPPYFETGFPHGRDQMASCMATALAATALMQALPAASSKGMLVSSAPSPASATSTSTTAPEPAWMRVALFGRVDELQSLLDAGLDANSRTPRGTTILMMAAHDPTKVRLLLARGADPKAVSDARHTALMVAANYRGSIESMRLLLDAGASPLPPVVRTRTTQTGAATGSKQASPLLYAIWSGEIPKVQLLLDRGATLPGRLSVGGGVAIVTPIELALFLRDVPMVRFLASKGLDVNGLGETGITPLTGAVLGNDPAMVRALLALGAAVNQTDQQGETALMHAALIDFGDTAVVEILLGAGADRGVRSPEKLTARELAEKHGHTTLARLLN